MAQASNKPQGSPVHVLKFSGSELKGPQALKDISEMIEYNRNQPEK